MLDGRSPDGHGFGKVVQSSKHIIDNIFIDPAFNPPLFSRCAFGFDRTGLTSIRPVNLHVASLFNGHKPVCHFLATWALIAIVFRLVEEVVFAKAACSFRARCIRLRHISCRAQLFSRHDLCTAKITTIGKDCDIFTPDGSLALRRHFC